MTTAAQGSVRRAVPLIITLIGVVVLLALGTWQLQRRAWKHELLATLAVRAAIPPVPLPDRIDDPAAWDYRRIIVSGRFADGQDRLRIARPREGRAGYDLLTPLVPVQGGAPVLVNRGFVPLSWQDPAKRQSPITGPQPVTVTGVARPLPADLSFDGIPLLVEALPEGPALPDAYPQPEPPRAAALPDNHLQYAITWYALAGALATIYLIDRHRSRSRHRSRARQQNPS